MTSDNRQNDESLAAIAALRSHDVSPRRAARLRARCHAALETQSRRHAPAGRAGGVPFRRIIGPAVGGAWCLAYLLEVIRRAAAIYGF